MQTGIGKMNEIRIPSVIWWRHSLFLMILKLIMDKLIDSVKTADGYRIGKKSLNDSGLAADTEDNFYTY